MKKKILSILLALVMVLAISPVSVFAEDDILDYLTYEINNGEVTITDCDTSISDDVVIPNTIEGCPVTSIGNYAFWYCSNIESIIIPESVTSIGQYAFSKCGNLTSIIIPESVISIDYLAFDNCTSLANITVAETNKYYSSDEYGVLFNKDKTILMQYPTGNSRTEYTPPDSVTAINSFAFRDCTNLVSIVISDSITTIEGYAFSRCTSLTEITISESVTSIDNSAFDGCTNLANITVAESNKYYSSDKYGVLFNKDKTELIRYPIGNSETEYTIPNSVTSIGGFIFYGCRNITSITIPESVTSIGVCAVGYCYDENRGEPTLINGFTIYGYAGSVAETYANGNGITFIALEPGDDVVVPDEPVTEEPIPDEPVTEEPTPDEPVTEELTPDEPVQDKESNVLKPNVDSHIFVADTVATINPETDLSSFRGQIENKNVQILDKDGNELATDAFVGTGAKINILDADGKVLSTYEIMVKSDVDGNGKVTPADARLALRAAAGLDTLAGVYETAANFDEKDTISTSDARMILRKAAGLE